MCGLLLIGILAGCTTYGPAIDIDDYGAMTAEMAQMESQEAARQFRTIRPRAGLLPAAERRGEFEQPIDSLQLPKTARPESTRAVIRKTPPGSYVRLSGPLLSHHEGTLLKVQGNTVCLANCYGREAVKGFDGTVVAKTTFAPYLEVDLAALSHLDVIAVPHKSDPLAPREEVVHEITFVSGRRRSVEVPRLPDWMTGHAQAPDSLERLPPILLSTTPGSMITLRDEAGRWYEGAFLSVDDIEVKLNDCIVVESCRDPSGKPYSKVHYTLAQAVPTASIIDVNVLAPPAAIPERSEDDCENCDYCVESFHFHSGSQRPLKWTYRKYTDEELAKLNGETTFNPIRPFGSPAAPGHVQASDEWPERAIIE
jgi:hypothetical protein